MRARGRPPRHGPAGHDHDRAARVGPDSAARRSPVAWQAAGSFACTSASTGSVRTPGPWGRETAALLACGPDAVLSHWTAARIHGLTDRGGTDIHVSIAGRLAGRVAGIRPHRASRLPPRDVVVKDGVRVTTPARTLLDLAAVTPRDLVERLTEEALVQRVVTESEIRATVAQAAGRPGVRKLRAGRRRPRRAVVHALGGEKRLRSLLRSAGLPLPLTNVKRAGWEVDAVWDAQRLVVEVDGRKFHDTGPQFERDRRKDADLVLAGFRVLRFTWRRLTREPAEVVAIIAAALAHAQQERSAPR